MKQHVLRVEDCRHYVEEIFGQMHKKRQHSLADAALGILASGSLLLHEIGEGLAEIRGLVKKHAVKQVDRLLSNEKLDIWDLSSNWVPYIVGERKEIIVILDWTSFADDNQSTLSLNLLTHHGRATPLLWQTVEKSRLKNNRARYEDQMLSKLKESLPEDVRVTLIADRGFADKKFFEFLEDTLNFNYIIRIKSNTYITSETDEQKPARDWLRNDGRAHRLTHAKITKDNFVVKQFVAVKHKGMKDGWFIASNCDYPASRIIKLYGRRWSIEPYFRDLKDIRFGFGMSFTHTKKPERRDRLLLMMSLCYVLLTLLGAAGEQLGLDKYLKVNTVKTRTHSLVRQGEFYFRYFPKFKSEQQSALIERFDYLLEQQPQWQKLLFVC
jgi:Transposase DDE domain